MNYSTAFDFLDAGYPVWPSVFGLIAFVVGVAAYHQRINLMPNRAPGTRLVLVWGFMGGSLIVTALISWMLYSEHQMLSDATEHNKLQVVEGRVSGFVPFLDGGSVWERFCVNATCFKYSNLVPTAGFNRTVRYGGPIKDGLYVRVFYTGNLIVKLETAE